MNSHFWVNSPEKIAFCTLNRRSHLKILGRILPYNLMNKKIVHDYFVRSIFSELPTFLSNEAHNYEVSEKAGWNWYFEFQCTLYEKNFRNVIQCRVSRIFK